MENSFKQNCEDAEKEIYRAIFEAKQKHHLTTPELVLILTHISKKWLQSFCSWQNHTRTQNENELMSENDNLKSRIAELEQMSGSPQST